MFASVIVIIGAVINAWGGVSYLIDTLKGKAKPNRVTWFLWALAPLIAFAAEIQQGVGIQSLLTFTVGFMPLLILGASFVNKKSEWKITRFDVICGVFSLLGIILWSVTKVANVAVIFSILADFCAALPTIVKSYSYPETENGNAYLATIISGVLTLATVPSWTLGYVGFPLYVTLICTVFVYLITVRPMFQKRKHASYSFASSGSQSKRKVRK